MYHKITVATGLLQNNAYGHEFVLFCLIIPCVHCHKDVVTVKDVLFLQKV